MSIMINYLGNGDEFVSYDGYEKIMSISRNTNFILNQEDNSQTKPKGLIGITIIYTWYLFILKFQD